MKIKWFSANITLPNTINVWLLFVVLTSCFACSEKQDKGGSSQIIQGLKEIRPGVDLKLFRNILIIPSAGCAGCITTAEKFVLQHINELDSTLIVFTRISTKKIFNLKFGFLSDKPNVILDFDDILGQNGFSSIYPACIIVADDSNKRIEYLSPENEYSLTELLLL